MNNISYFNKDKIDEILPEIINIRHLLHRHPELSNNEYKTADIICQKLKSWGYTPITDASSTGVSAILDSTNPGKTVALRADMDALPIQEKTNINYASENTGVMHACGHDGHIATLLLAAYILRDAKFSGKIKFIFQPAEEIGEGADAMIKQGILNNPSVDAIFGYHNIPNFPQNKIIIRPKCIMAGASRFKITIKGVGGHSSTPEKTVDPIYIGSMIIPALHSIVSRSIDPSEPVVISVTQFHAGHADNVIPDIAFLHGTIRFTSNDKLKIVTDKMDNIVSELAKSLGGSASIEFVKTVPATINSLAETNLVRKVACDIFGDDNVIDLESNFMATEDFSFFLNRIPGCYFMVGTGINKKFIHHPEYIFEDEIIPVASVMLASVALRYLEQNNNINKFTENRLATQMVEGCSSGKIFY